MEEKRVRALAALMQQAGLTVLEVSEGDFRLRMERAAAQTPAALPAEAKPEAKREPDEAFLFTVASPMVGIFFGVPAQGAAPFVSCGDTVRAGDVVCLIEAMKMMNEITAGVDGVVTEVCAGEGQVVEYGHPLFRIRPLTADAGAREGENEL